MNIEYDESGVVHCDEEALMFFAEVGLEKVLRGAIDEFRDARWAEYWLGRRGYVFGRSHLDQLGVCTNDLNVLT